MTIRKFFVTAFSLATALLLAVPSTSLLAAPLLSVDFQHATNATAGVTQSGFQAFQNNVDPSTSDTRSFATIAGNILVTISGKTSANDGMFTRGGVANVGSLTFADIYNDFAFNNINTGPNGNKLALSLSGAGITPNTDYSLTFWSYDSLAGQGNHSVAINGISGTVGSAVPIVYTPGVNPTTNLQYATKATFTSDGLGVLNIELIDTITGTVTAPTTGIRLNGIELNHPLLINVSSYVYDGVGGEASGAQPSTFLANGNLLDTGMTELIDGHIVLSGGFDQPGYVGFRDQGADDGTSHPQVTFNLGGLYDVHTIAISYRDVEATIQEPDSVLISVSTDGVNFSTPFVFNSFIGTGGAVVTTPIDVTALDYARYVRLDFRQSGEWLLLSEVSFTGILIPEPSAWLLLVCGTVGVGLLLRRRKR